MLRPVLLVFAFLLLLSAPASAGFDEGQTAYNNRDWGTAIKELLPLSDSGDERAMLLLATMHYNAFGLPQDFNEAMRLFKRAAVEKNNPEAMLGIASMYTGGQGVPINLNMAMQWFRRAALLGNQSGAFFYATILFQGNQSTADDIRPDLYNSYKWFKIAAKIPQNVKLQSMSDELAGRLAEQKLLKEDITKADKEVAEWKPSDIAGLGPVPADPAPVKQENTKQQDVKQEEKKP